MLGGIVLKREIRKNNMLISFGLWTFFTNQMLFLFPKIENGESCSKVKWLRVIDE